MRFTLTVPHNYNDGTPCSVKNFTGTILAERAGGFQAVDGIGGGPGLQGEYCEEPVRIFTIYCDDAGFQDWLIGAAAAICDIMAQDSVFVTVNDTPIFVRKDGV